MVDPHQLAHGPWEHADPDDTELVDAREHLLGEPALEDPALEVVAVDEKRSEQRLEARHTQRVEDARPDPGHVDLAFLDVLDRSRLRVRIARPPFRRELDA